jgi:penicillin amidase
MDFSKNPSAVNPEWNFVYSANNQAEAVDGFYILVIIFQKTELKELPIEPKSDWTKESVGKMLNDNTSLVAPIVVKNLISERLVRFQKMKRSCFYFKLVERNE